MLSGGAGSTGFGVEKLAANASRKGSGFFF
jgi:hypothetical protein